MQARPVRFSNIGDVQGRKVRTARATCMGVGVGEGKGVADAGVVAEVEEVEVEVEGKLRVENLAKGLGAKWAGLEGMESVEVGLQVVVTV